jgi:flagellar hook-associated protein 2
MAEVAATESVTSQIMTTLGAGSGLDITKLATDLTSIEKAPKQAKIEAAVAATEAKISAYGLISYQVSLLQTAFEALNDADELATNSASSTDVAVSISTPDGTAEAGSHTIDVTQLALEQRVKSTEYSSSSSSLNAGSSFDLTFAVGASSITSTTVTVTTDTPAGVVSAINAADMGITASLIDTGIAGANYRIVLSGATGSEGAFSVSSTPDLGFADAGNSLQSAQDAQLDFNGLTVTRSSNEVSDLISGATVTLNSVTSAAARLTVSSDQSTLKTGIENVVTVYNDFRDIMDTFIKAPQEDVEFSGALVRDMAVARHVMDQVRSALFDDSSTASGDISGLRDIGISINQKGQLTFDEDDYATAIADSYDDVVMMLTANTSDQNLYGTDAKGLAQDIATTLEGLTDSESLLATRETSAEEALESYAEQLEELETRMAAVYDRYLGQFAAMETMMERLNGTRDYLEGQLESLSKAYDK